MANSFFSDRRVRKWGGIAAACLSIFAFSNLLVRPLAFMLGLATTQQLEAVEVKVQTMDTVNTHNNTTLHNELHAMQKQIENLATQNQRQIERLGCALAPAKFEECKQLTIHGR